MAKRDKPKRAARPSGELPSKEELLEFISNAPQRVGKREIAKAFGIKGGERVLLKHLLAEMADEGLIAGTRKELRSPGSLPPIAPLEIIEVDPDGELIAVPVVWEAEDGQRPRVHIAGSHSLSSGKGSKGHRREPVGIDRPLGVGDRVLARISRADDPEEAFDCDFVAEPFKRLPRERARLIGIYRKTNRGGGLVAPVDRKNLREWEVARGDDGGAKEGDLVRFDLARKGRLHVPQARIVEVLGNPEDQRQISLIAVHAHGIPDEFPEGVLTELDTLPHFDPRKRQDLTGLPLVTIDPVDARDHDDAVHAAPDPDPANGGGFVVTVAIADVAHYVRPGTRLDREARKRGNSCYFPDRVVPMLPERISNDLCSLREGELRPCLAVRMRFDSGGTKIGHTFQRASMRSARKLSYSQAQAAFDGNPGPEAEDIAETVLMPLLDAYRALAKARDRRAPLDLDLPERKIVLDEAGRVADVVVPARLEAHRLIEEMMIQANVAAAETLETRRAPVVYRVHDQPSKEKIDGLRDFLDSLGLKLPAANVLKPADINGVLERAKELPVPQLVNEVVLRSQSQAVYAIENLGHFGLNLKRYAHFTSPIRRYADLLVHRALIGALDLGTDGMTAAGAEGLADVAQAISDTERRAMAAERETTDRLIAAYLADRLGATFAARVSGVVRFGLFVRLDETGADGFIPAVTIAGEAYYEHVEDIHALVDVRSGRGWRLGDTVQVRLVEAVPTAGALRFELLSEPEKISLTAAKGRGSRQAGARPRGRGVSRDVRRPGRR